MSPEALETVNFETGIGQKQGRSRSRSSVSVHWTPDPLTFPRVIVNREVNPCGEPLQQPRE
jgi:hypothetical protein